MRNEYEKKSYNNEAISRKWLQQQEKNEYKERLKEKNVFKRKDRRNRLECDIDIK